MTGNGPAHHRRAYVSEYGNATGEHAMMAEVYSRGPIACSMNVCLSTCFSQAVNSNRPCWWRAHDYHQASNPDFEGLRYAGYNSQIRSAKDDIGKRIFIDRHKSENRDTTHVVSIVGWGVDEETELKYWVGPSQPCNVCATTTTADTATSSLLLLLSPPFTNWSRHALNGCHVGTYM